MAAELRRILLASADPELHCAVRQALPEASWQVDQVAPLGEVYARLPPPGNAYDCLLVAALLDDGSAESLIRELRRRGVATPILAVLGDADAREPADSLLAAGATDYLPYAERQSHQLLRRIRHAIRSGQLEAGYRTAAAALQRAAQEREEILSLVSHDLRTPLNAIRIAADELLDPSLSAAERNLMLKAVQRSLRRADRLISDLLDASRIEAGTLTLSCTALATKSLLEQAGSDSAESFRTSGLELRIEVDAEVGMVYADRDRMLQALDNLLGNVVRHARGSGLVILAARSAQGQVEISVTDRGPGIAAERLPQIFNRFDPARKQHRAGVGLGLAIVKGIVTAHGGSITAKSTPGQGTSIHFSLPRAL